MRKGFLFILLCFLLVGCSKTSSSTPDIHEKETMATSPTPAPSTSILDVFSDVPLKEYSVNGISYKLPETWVESAVFDKSCNYIIDMQTHFMIYVFKSSSSEGVNFKDESYQNVIINALNKVYDKSSLISRTTLTMPFDTVALDMVYYGEEEISTYNRCVMFQYNNKMCRLLITTYSKEKLDYLNPIIESLTFATP